VHCSADLQSVRGFGCYDNIHVRKLIALYTANAYSAEREMSASTCTVSDYNLLAPSFVIVVILVYTIHYRLVSVNVYTIVIVCTCALERVLINQPTSD